MNDRDTIWAYRLLLAEVADNIDAYHDTVREIIDAGGCWSCIASEALGIAVAALYDRFTVDGSVDTEAAAAWVEHALDSELEHEP